MAIRALPILFAASACVVPTADESVIEENTTSLHEASTIVALTFDDTFADNFQVGEMASSRGMRVVFYVNSTRIGTSGSMTQQQLLDLQADGHEIGGHTLSHANLTSLAEPDARAQVCNDRVALLDAGLAARTFAYPFGANNATVESIVADCGYNSARDVGGLVAPGSCGSCPSANPLPPPNPYALRTQSSVGNSTSLATLQEYVVQAEQNGGGLVPIVFHHVCDDCGSNAVSPATLAAFMDWLAERGPDTQVATIHDVIGGALQPGVAAPPPTSEPPPASNLIRNPSLEVDADGNQVPDCWQRGGTGSSTFSYALVNDAYDGDIAQRITISSWSSGGRRLVTAQDLGTCAAPVTPGRTYTMTAFYKATTQPRFSVYYRTGSGGWVWFAQSPLMPTSSTYREATYTTPPLPAEATAISLGLTIFSVGTITMDAYKLVDSATTPPPGDTTPPSLSIACNGGSCSSSAYANPVTVTLDASDAGSGLDEVRYTTDGSDPTSGAHYTTPFTLSASATVRATAVDNAGNRTSQSSVISIGQTPPPSSNLLWNPSLETGGSTTADCWRGGGYGTNTASFSIVTDAYDGSRAARVEITSWSSGGRRVLSLQDAGACAPTVEPGRRYAVSAYYKATAAPRFTIYYRTSAGSWVWFAESSVQPTSSTYREATYTTPALPAGATHISVAHSIYGVGTLTSDAFSLVEVP